MKLIDIDLTPALKAVLAVPEGVGPWPTVVMVHEVFGIDENMRAQMTRLASAGYLVLMPDLYSRGGARKCLTATFKALSSGTGQAFEDIEKAKEFLLARPDSNGKVGVIGFCMGGGFALLLANQKYDASVSNYGMLPTNLDEALAGACPILGNYGGKDKQLSGAKAKLDATLTTLGVVHDVKEYPEAGHAFMNPKQGGGAFFGTLLKITGAKPNPEAAVDAWNRIEGFFGEHLA
ncbi:MAG: dienelactone hydrolase family protein [Rhodoluna sp.]|nr:dienelactone hydrolase family protein [Rhodoluna sp.]